MNYKDLLEPQKPKGTLLQYKINPKSYGYLITKITSYVTITKIKLLVNEDRSAKAVYKVNKNYHSPYQFTLYFDCNGKEIKATKLADSWRKDL